MLAETLKGLKIKDAGCYESESENANDAKGDSESDPKIDTHTSDVNKRKITDTSNGDLQQKLLINRSLPIITTMLDPWIDDRVVTYGTSLHKLMTQKAILKVIQR